MELSKETAIRLWGNDQSATHTISFQPLLWGTVRLFSKATLVKAGCENVQNMLRYRKYP